MLQKITLKLTATHFKSITMRFQMSCLECDSQIPESISQMELFHSEIM